MQKMVQFREKILSGDGLDKDDAGQVLNLLKEGRLLDVMNLANEARMGFKGNEVSLCSIINAKSGMCGEDCAFCSQSMYHRTTAPVYPLVSTDKIMERAMDAQSMLAREFSIVTSGYGPENQVELREIALAITNISEKTNLEPCASLGILDRESLKILRDAGLRNYHHNLETSESFFQKICTTHPYEEDVAVVKNAKELGFRVCCGGIFGMGETWEQRLELAFTLKELDVDSIPINFLNPIPGTRLENTKRLTPVECLEIICLYRLILPAKDIFICGGREVNLRDLQSMLFFAGANGMMIGGYLTTKGREPEDDLRMINDLGLKIKI